MALPKINENPSYPLTIPSTKQQVTFRPFLVKEQKVLLIAMEAQDEMQVVRSIAHTIEACVNENIDISKLTNFDLEYAFTMIRAKSVGETSTIEIKCSECEESTVVKVDLSEVRIDVPTGNNMIQLNEKFTLQLKYPDYTSIIHLDGVASSAVEAIYNTTLLCLDKLHTDDELINFKDYDMKAQTEFVEGLSSEQFDKIMEFINNIPKLTHDIEFDCESCNHHNTVTLRGIQDFF